MLLGKVIGTIVATQKEELINGFKLLLVQTLHSFNDQNGNLVVCVDVLNTGIGELIMYTAGSSARQTNFTQDKPIDHIIVGIIDSVVVNNKLSFTKKLGFIKDNSKK